MRREGEDTNKYYKKETNRKEEDKESIWEQCNWCDRGPHSSALPIIKLFGIQTHIPPSLFILIIIHFTPPNIHTLPYISPYLFFTHSHFSFLFLFFNNIFPYHLSLHIYLLYIYVSMYVYRTHGPIMIYMDINFNLIQSASSSIYSPIHTHTQQQQNNCDRNLAKSLSKGIR